LFRTVGVRTEQQARNRQEVTKLLDAALDTTLDSFLPWQSIVSSYFSAPSAEAAEAAADEPAEAPVEAPKVIPSVSFSDDTDDEDDDDEETDDEDQPKLTLSDEAVDLGDLVESLDAPSVQSKPDEKVVLEVPTETLVLKL
jgi:hypothetical protein